MEQDLHKLLNDVVSNRFEPNETKFRTKLSLLLQAVRIEEMERIKIRNKGKNDA